MQDRTRRRVLGLLGLAPASALAASSRQAQPAPPDANATFTQPSSDASARRVVDKLRETVSVRDFGAQADGHSDDRGAFLKATRHLADGGGALHLPAGTSRISDTVTLGGQRLRLRGDGANISNLRFNPPSPAVAISLDAGDAGGIYQAGIEGVGFLSENDVDKTAIELVNGSACAIEDVGIASNNWRGAGSIGIRTRGRDSSTISDCVIGCARPLVHSPNPHHPHLCVDHFRVERSEFVSTSGRGACIEFESGTVITSASYQKLALVGGRDAIRWIDRASPSASFNLHLSDIRTEQGRDPRGWSINLDTKRGLQSLLVENARLDSARNGIRLRNVHRVTLVNVDIDQNAAPDKTLIDMVGVPGTVLIMINCFGQVGGTVSLANMRRVHGVAPYGSGQPFGPYEVWVYDSGDVRAAARQGRSGTLTHSGTLAAGASQDLKVGSGQSVRIARIEIDAFGKRRSASGTVSRTPNHLVPLSVAQDFAVGNAPGKLCLFEEGAAVWLVNNLDEPVEFMASIRFLD